MIIFVNSLKQLGLVGLNTIDIYVSCDSVFAEDILYSILNFKDYYDEDNKHPSPDFIESEMDNNILGHSLRYEKCIIDVIEYTIDKDLKARKELGNKGFPIQTFMRIYKSQSTSLDGLLEDIRAAFNQFQQNVAILTPDHSKAYVCLASNYF